MLPEFRIAGLSTPLAGGVNSMHQAKHDADFYRRVEVITGGCRRRVWSDAGKSRIIAESADPDNTIISEVARRGLLTVWLRFARSVVWRVAAGRLWRRFSRH